MARPSKFTDETVTRLDEAFRAGMVSIKEATAYAGISEDTYYGWMRQGREGDPKFEGFVQRMEQARANSHMIALLVIRKAANEGNWQAAAWWLERTRPDQYGRRQRIDMVTRDSIEEEIMRLEAELAEQGVDVG